MFAGIILHVRECTISMQLFNRKDIPLRENLATQIFPQQNSFACISSPLFIKINRVQTCTEQPGDHFFQVYRTHQLTSEIKIILFSQYFDLDTQLRMRDGFVNDLNWTDKLTY